MNTRRLLIVVALLLAFVAPSLAQKTVHVKGYTKKDGTVVKPHDRKAPGSSTTPSYPTTPEAPAPSTSSVPSTTAADAVQPTQPAERAGLSVVFVDGGPRGTALYHRAGCPWLKASGAVLSTYSVADAERRYFRAHCLCVTGRDVMPPCAEAESTAPAGAVTAAAAIAPQGASRVPDARPAMETATANATETVYVTRTGAKYHRAGCRYLSKSATPMALKNAASGYSPCSVCKPSVLSAR